MADKTGKTTKPTKGLGRGLSSLLGEAANAPIPAASVSGAATPKASDGGAVETAGPRQAEIRLVPVEWINPGPWQPRRVFNRSALDELAQSMRENGVVQPILVRPNPEKAGRFQLIAGERRWRAAQIAQLHDIPAIIRDIDDKQAAEFSLIENIQRQDLTAIEEALGYRTLIDAHGYNQETLADIVGKSRPHISNMMRLLSLPDDVHKMLFERELTAGQVRPLVGRDDALALALKIRDQKLSARDVEKMLKQESAEKQIPQKPEKTSDIKALEKKAQSVLGVRLSIDWQETTEKGAVKIKINNFGQLDMILDKLGLNENSQS